jgi:hypothetical protein
MVPGTAGRRIAVAAFLALALMAVAIRAAAQTPAVQVRGLVDIVATDDTDYRYFNTVNTGDSYFDALRTRLFVEAARGQTSVYLQFLVSPESYNAWRFYGGYLMHRVWDERNVFVEAGLIPVLDGIWASHTYSNKNPLVGIPMAYYWKSSMTATMMPENLDQVLEKRGEAQEYGVIYTDSTGAVRGKKYAAMPILYDNCWNYGLYSLGTLGRFEFAAGVTLGSAGAAVQGSDTNENIAIHGKVGYAVTPGLTLTLSATHGAYLDRVVTPYLPAGKTVNDYFQDLVGVSAEWRWGQLNLMGEYWWNHVDTPVRADGLDSESFWLQAVYTFLPGWDAAVRVDAMRFEEVEDSAGNVLTWDQDVDRCEAGVGYHYSRNLFLKGVAQFTRTHEDWELIPAVQASFSF